MSLPAIEVSGLSKRYVIQHESQHDNLRDTLHHSARKLWRKLRWGTGFEKEEFWALRDISFSVQPGEVLGIIGRNGAGKSTLLKVLSRITEPTAGKIKLRGRVASLLEVGTGFHPELSGRENIFLNGAILGMSRAEIQSKFDEIVAFAEVEQFLDTPVKRYSSGMYVRLAFAVAAHLEPEILIIDEVLAVGDQQFQAKCLGKMKDVAEGQGRTVLFVSHNLAATQSLCSRVITLASGSTVFDGLPDQAVSRYLSGSSLVSATIGDSFQGSDPALNISQVGYHPDPQKPTVDIDLTIRCASAQKIGLEFHLSTASGVPAAFAESGSFSPDASLHLETGDHSFSLKIDVSHLANGPYFLAVQLVEPGNQVKLRVDYPTLLDVYRSPIVPARRVLEQSWHVGYVQLPVSRE